MRTFIAVEIPRMQRELVYKIIEEEKKRKLPIKWVEFENLHITLKFLGEIDEKKKNDIMPIISKIAKKFKPFSVQLNGIGCFPSPKNPRVLWIGVLKGEDSLIGLANDLENALLDYGFKKEDKKFHPHLTIGRIKNFCKIDDILAKDVQTEPFVVNSITLFKSTLKPEGPIYEELAKFPFSTVS